MHKIKKLCHAVVKLLILLCYFFLFMSVKASKLQKNENCSCKCAYVTQEYYLSQETNPEIHWKFCEFLTTFGWDMEVFYLGIKNVTNTQMNRQIHLKFILTRISGCYAPFILAPPVLPVTEQLPCAHASTWKGTVVAGMCKRSVVGLRPTTARDQNAPVHTRKQV